jgi:hypothetical protein
LAEFIPGVGIIGITSDYNDFRVFGYDLRWSKSVSKYDVSSPVRNEVSSFTAANVSFGYINGKILMSDGTGVFYALHVKEGKGWTKYSFPMNSTAQRLFVFGNGLRAAVVSKNTHLVEIEKSGITVDVDTSDDDEAEEIDLSETTHRFQSREGKDILEMNWLSVTGLLSQKLVGALYVNGQAWPSITSETATDFAPDPNIHVQSNLKDREYRLYIEPETVGAVAWQRPHGNQIHFVITTKAPAVIRDKNLNCIVDQSGMNTGAYDPFQTLNFAGQGPVWGVSDLLSLTFDDDSDTAQDVSGNNRDHAWADGDGSRTVDTTMTPDGGQTLANGGGGSGYTDADWTGFDWISSGLPLHPPISRSCFPSRWSTENR